MRAIPKINQGEEAFLGWCRIQGVRDPARNYRFHPTRKWEIDFAWPEVKIGVEVQGGIFMKGGAHALPTNIRRDLEKHNALLDLGWRVWHFMPEHIERGAAVQHIATVLRLASNDAHAARR